MMMAIGMTGSISRTDEEFEGGEGWRGCGGSATNSRNSRMAGTLGVGDEFEKHEDGQDRKRAQGHYRTRI